MGLFLKKGERGLLVGQTGSGKTQNALYQLRNPVSYPVIIFDTKIEDAFFDLRTEFDSLDVVEGLSNLQRYAKQPIKDQADYIIVRPTIVESQDFDALSDYATLVYNQFGKCFIYFDELYNWHNQNRPTNGMIGLYTRGRSKGKTVLGATQRPSWISRFCLTECQKFYIHDLIDKKDKQRLADIIPDYMEAKPLKKYHFHFYETGEPGVITFSPVEIVKHDISKVFTQKWI